MKTKICCRCEKEKSIKDFYKDKNTKDGLQGCCKKCRDISRKEYRKNNPIRYWCSDTLNNHKQKGFEVLLIWKELFSMAQKTIYCPICGIKVEYGGKRSQKNATLDRINNEKILTLSNTQIICHKCNVTKYDRTLKEMIKWCKSFLNYTLSTKE